ncbi:Class I SAM-dependent methyltransferase [Nitrospira tepida]|uniref:Class I SAM-dependent methyltransferase n=2 Tax=Nitrospira tepida TaxID=2973512 RepID=A0AA86N3J6_9BACT|nr:Class I SAM-dependent methyltransferase [Nitrospira tepida]
MGFYARQIFPRLMDWGMRRGLFQQEREAALAPAHGDVLEIGFGTGLNLPHYPPSIARLTGVDPMQALPARVTERCRAVSFPVQVVPMTAETLPFDHARFDCAVSTWTLCTIPDPVAALREVKRVLKPGGLFLFAEHGRSDHPRVAAWQDRLNPIQNVVGCGCNLNRRIDRLILDAGLTLDRLDRFELPGVPRIAGTMYRGQARA